ncbi:MAG: FCD domain-containing protein [Hungatella sp.]|nr:FCD domain-containing protein [Hungatella sp.]
MENIFHSYLIQLVGNPYISSVMNLVLDHNMRFVVLGARLPNRLEHSNDEHVQILNALLDGNEKAAEELMREHIQYARVSAFESMSLSPAMVGNIHQDSAHKEYEK